MILFLLVLISVLIYIDQYTKKRAREDLAHQKIEHKNMTFTLVKNNGAFKGLLKDNPLLLLVIQAVGVIFILILLLSQLISKKDKILSVGLSLILAGAIGNLIDRMTNKYVTDFFAFKWTKNLYYNLADMYIFLGAVITLIKGNKL